VVRSSRFTVFALGIMPYISASIIMQLVSIVSPQMEALKKEGEAGRRKITQYTRYFTVVLATFQALGIAVAWSRRQAWCWIQAMHSVRDGRYAVDRHHVRDVVGRADYRAWSG
jgi:preprotein translocase subunit SecY